MPYYLTMIIIQQTTPHPRPDWGDQSKGQLLKIALGYSSARSGAATSAGQRALLPEVGSAKEDYLESQWPIIMSYFQ